MKRREVKQKLKPGIKINITTFQPDGETVKDVIIVELDRSTWAGILDNLLTIMDIIGPINPARLASVSPPRPPVGVTPP